MVRSLIHVRGFIYTLHRALGISTPTFALLRGRGRRKGRREGQREGKREGGMTLTCETHKELTFHHARTLLFPRIKSLENLRKGADPRYVASPVGPLALGLVCRGQI